MNTIETLLKLEAAALEFPGSQLAVEIVELLRESELHAEFFFSKLNDPRWIVHLQGRGFFESTPAKRMKSDGSVSHPHSPALAALARLIPSTQKIAAVIYSFTDPKGNIAVSDQMLRGIAEISDHALIARMAPVVCRLLSPSSQSTWIWLESILKKWHEVKAVDPLLEILSTILDRSLGVGHGRSGDSWQIAEIDREIIAPLAQQRPKEVMECVFLALCRWGAAGRHEERAETTATNSDIQPDRDLPNTYWLESFKTGSHFAPDPEDIIVRRLFEIGNWAFSSSDEGAASGFDTLLRSDRWQLFQRLRWQLYADHPGKSLKWARQDTLERIPLMGMARHYHNYEFAQMLEALSQAHGSAYITAAELDRFVQEVLSGPSQADGAISEDDRREYFQRTQLHPIRSLLNGEGLALYQHLSEGKRDLKQRDYKPFSSCDGGTVQFVAPARANEMGLMSDTELWNFLNTWKPASRFSDPENWLVEESAGALGWKFTEFLESNSERFNPETRWWENLRRPAVLHKPLERFTERIAKKPQAAESTPKPPTEYEWRNCFGIADWITQQEPIIPVEPTETAGGIHDEQLDWNWPRIVVAKFLTTALSSPFQYPADLYPEIGRLFRKLVEDDDPRLTSKDRPWMDDWLNTAINSVRGTAFEGLLDFALLPKKADTQGLPEDWILDVIDRSLRRSDQSPAIFAILGSRAGAFLHIFGNKLEDAADLLLPPNRHDCGVAFIMAHYHYHNAMPDILKNLPALPMAALDCLNELTEESEDRRRERSDFGGRLGFHLAFYYWNDAYRSHEEADAVLDRFFEIAKPTSRAKAIGEIGRIFETAQREDKHADLFDRAMHLWDRRLGRIERLIRTREQQAADFAAELGEFIDWLACECFPFEWRYDRVAKALDLLEMNPRAYPLIETLDQLSGEHLPEVMNILQTLISKSGDEIRWSYREERMKPLLRRGLTSTETTVRKVTAEIQETLLRHGCFEYLHLDS